MGGYASPFLRACELHLNLQCVVALFEATTGLGVVRLGLHRMALSGAFQYLGLGLPQSGQTLLASRDLRRHNRSVVDGPVVSVLAQLEQQLHLLAKRGFDLVGVLR